MAQLVAHVTGLTCQHCVATVTTALEALVDIESVAVELVNGGQSRVVLTTTSSDDLVAPVAQALASHGYVLESLSADSNH